MATLDKNAEEKLALPFAEPTFSVTKYPTIIFTSNTLFLSHLWRFTQQNKFLEICDELRMVKSIQKSLKK